ncbi:hypothetical protein QJS04_geneDACA005763 [Acorus gramineus]|uniref:rhamnogalacturonan endolyase n=1 Tax=Acorus gramineus TaxID=55184 RepID=A0AAV9BIS2_ACOGR|nr:hypothetical protein QJS04_geneDACA005763 [Acorus gramineus]
MENDYLQVTFMKPNGKITGIRYNGVDNLLDTRQKTTSRGSTVETITVCLKMCVFCRVNGDVFKVIHQDENMTELSFSRSWDPSFNGTISPLNIDQRFIMLRGSSGFYTYAVYEHQQGWPDFDLIQTRVAFKLNQNMFRYMAIADNRQRIMPSMKDRTPPQGEPLAYPEAVRLIAPSNGTLKGEVDDKYQYSCNNMDNRVHGWICSDPPIGFWHISASDEFRTGGPLKQDLTSHVGPTTLAMFFSNHYAGQGLNPTFQNGESWRKTFGPIFIYLNSNHSGTDNKSLWEDAKLQMQKEVESWPYSFPVSDDFPKADERGSVRGQLVVRDRYINQSDIPADSAYIGLAPPGEAGSWQRESKGYQFWTNASSDGSFSIKNVRSGDYNLYAWVPGIMGDYKYNVAINITAKCDINLGELVYEPPRDGPTLWEIGVPDRLAAEFFIPDPDPDYVNKLYINHTDRFRQYGLWERYSELYPNSDLIYNVGVDDYKKDWFFAHVTRKIKNNTYEATTWQIRFRLDRVVKTGATYTLRVALASAVFSELQVRFNNMDATRAHFSTGLIGKDNAIARHGDHGIYWPFNISVQSAWLMEGENTIFLTQARGSGLFQGIMYDYIRFEGPPSVENASDKLM